MRRMFLFLSLVGCGAETGGFEADGKIFGGSPVSTDYQRAAVSLHDRSTRGVATSPGCSGALIAADWVLTAGHCVVTARGTVSPAGTVAVYVGDDPAVDLASHTYFVDQVELHPSYDPATLSHDVGLLHLASAVTEVAPVPPLGRAKGVRGADVGVVMDIVGFGSTESGGYGQRLHVRVPMAAMGCPTGIGCPAGFTGSPFDQMIFSYRQTGTTSATTDDRGPCSGDSGGPALLRRGTAWYVAGVSSWGDAGCRAYGVSASVSYEEAWIESYTGDLNGM